MNDYLLSNLPTLPEGHKWSVFEHFTEWTTIVVIAWIKPAPSKFNKTGTEVVDWDVTFKIDASPEGLVKSAQEMFKRQNKLELQQVLVEQIVGTYEPPPALNPITTVTRTPTRTTTGSIVKPTTNSSTPNPKEHGNE